MRNIIFSIILLFIAVSCDTLVSDQFPDFDAVPTLNCILIAGDTVKVHLSMTEKIDSSDIQHIDHAQVSLSVDGETEIPLSYTSEGIYLSTEIACSNSIYSCTVLQDSFPELSAVDSIPLPVPVTNLEFHPVAGRSEDGYVLNSLSFSFEDNQLQNDYYEVVIYKRRGEYTHEKYAFNERDPILLNEGLDAFSTESLVFSDELMEDTWVNMELEFFGDYVSCYNESCEVDIDEQTLILEFRHVSKEYYRFKKDLYLYEKNRYDIMFSGTMTNYPIYSNVTNGYGIFASYSKTVDSIQVEEETISL